MASRRRKWSAPASLLLQRLEGHRRMLCAAMPRTPYPKETVKQSVTLPMQLLPYVNERAKELGGFTDVIRELVQDAASFYDLPANQIERLDGDAKARGLSRRKHIQYVLSLHADRLLAEGKGTGRRSAK